MKSINNQREETRSKRAIKFNHRISQQKANELLRGSSTLCQVVLRKPSIRHKAGVPFFAYVVET